MNNLRFNSFNVHFLPRLIKKKANLQSLERTERMMVRWMCEVSLKLRKQCGFVQSFGVQSVAEVVRRGRLRWFGHVERKIGCRPVEMWWWQG